MTYIRNPGPQVQPFPTGRQLQPGRPALMAHPGRHPKTMKPTRASDKERDAARVRRGRQRSGGGRSFRGLFGDLFPLILAGPFAGERLQERDHEIMALLSQSFSARGMHPVF